MNKFILIAGSLMLSSAMSMAENVARHFSELYPGEFDPSQVIIHDSPFLKARDKNIEVLKAYDMDRLIAPFLKEAGLNPKAPLFDNWAGLDGHVGGHYLSALAIHYASTADPELLARMNYMLDELKRAQAANGDGYLGGVPDSRKCWDDLRKGKISTVKSRWVPWYNLHKTYAGLRDAYVYAGSEKAKEMFLRLCDWGVEVISGLDDKTMEKMLDQEFGGMNEVYADAYALTGNPVYLDTAIRFSHRWLLDSMANGVDNLDNRHANTQVPKAVGYQRVAEMCRKAGRTADAATFERAAEFFWDTVVNNRSLAIGGNSRREHFPAADDCFSYIEEREGPETCNTNNMLKLTEGLFRMNPSAAYGDFFERATFNHILSSQHPEHGGYVYFTPARPAHYRVYSQPNCAMWCCVGTGMENHGKYGQFIYTHQGPDSLKINLFVPSELHWDGLTVKQQTSFPYGESTIVRLSLIAPRDMTIGVRTPSWCKDFSMTVNGNAVYSSADPSGYMSVTRRWNDGDIIEVSLPMEFRLEEMPNEPDYVAIMRGPVVMAARMGCDDLHGLVADDSRWGHIAKGKLIALDETPVLVGTHDNILAKLNGLKSSDGKPLNFSADGLYENYADGKLILEPFSGIHDSRYMMYWLCLEPQRWAEHKELLREREAEKLRLDSLTVDAVNFGEQQPEADHLLRHDNSEAGFYNGQPCREAKNGWFSCMLETKGHDGLKLMLRRWGADTGKRTFDILIDGELFHTCTPGELSGQPTFEESIYTLPEAMTEGKSEITVKLQSHPGNTAGGIYYLRLVR